MCAIPAATDHFGSSGENFQISGQYGRGQQFTPQQHDASGFLVADSMDGHLQPVGDFFIGHAAEVAQLHHGAALPGQHVEQRTYFAQYLRAYDLRHSRLLGVITVQVAKLCAYTGLETGLLQMIDAGIARTDVQKCFGGRLAMKPDAALPQFEKYFRHNVFCHLFVVHHAPGKQYQHGIKKMKQPVKCVHVGMMVGIGQVAAV